jgi:hypothetical protein
MASGISSDRGPRVVALGKPEYIGDKYIEDFKKDFDYDVSHNNSNKTSASSNMPRN